MSNRQIPTLTSYQQPFAAPAQTGGSGLTSRRALLAASLLLATIIFGSCSANTGLLLKSDGSAVLSVQFEIPAVVEQRLKNLAGSEASIRAGSFFNAEVVSTGMLLRGFRVQEARLPAANSFSGVFTLPSLSAFLENDADMKQAGVLRLTRGSGWQELQLLINRGNATTLIELFPSLDRQLLESLSPPALYDLPVSKADYRSMLAALLGQAAISAMDQSSSKLSIQVPGRILEAEGGSISSDRRSLEFSLPILDAMVLEQPVSLRVRWSD